jgi:hypothetical protein
MLNMFSKANKETIPVATGIRVVVDESERGLASAGSKKILSVTSFVLAQCNRWSDTGVAAPLADFVKV